MAGCVSWYMLIVLIVVFAGAGSGDGENLELSTVRIDNNDTVEVSYHPLNALCYAQCFAKCEDIKVTR